MGRTLFWVLASVGITVGLTALLWVVFDLPVFFGFLFLPFFFGFGRLFGGGASPPPRTCPLCGFTTRDPEVRYCPRDATALE